VVLAVAGTTAVFTCAVEFLELITVRHTSPADPAAYARGDLGVVKPTFARRYLVQAYRTLVGLSPLPAPPTGGYVAASQYSTAFAEWSAIQKREIPPAAATALQPVRSERAVADYASFDNCLESAFATAVTAFKERAAYYGTRSPQLADWVRGQAAVFQNCGGTTLMLPAPTTADDPRLRADRDYQTAAAYFYATQYDEAAGRFRAIASNTASPWRPSARYLAARALIRSVTVPPMRPKDAAQRLATAERDLRATIADRDAAAFHASARGLLGFIAVRERPLERLHELARRLAAAPAVDPQDVVDYTWLMDAALGETAAGGAALDLAEVTRGDDLNAWIVDTQRRRADQAIERWRAARSVTTLIAALWSAPASHMETPALLSAAAAVPRSSPAFATAAFLRVRLLIQRGDIDGARTVLAALPAATGSGLGTETLNLLRAARFAIADSLDELLTEAPRDVAVPAGALTTLGGAALTLDRPSWDDDVAAVFNGRLPLDQLVAAAESTRLPARLRTRVAQNAFTRAVMLDRPEVGARAAAVLSQLAPQLRTDLTRYVSAPDQDARRRASVLILLRTPGLSINVIGRDTNDSYGRVEPHRVFGHASLRNWWCGVKDEVGDGPASLLTGPGRPPSPRFLSDAERQAANRERTALATAEAPREYLIREAIAWASTRPADRDAAEALALAIEGWRWSACTYDGPKSDLPRRAFARLHRQFPGSEWAKRTKYWYE
jgi:hypothetical protein